MFIASEDLILGEDQW